MTSAGSAGERGPKAERPGTRRAPRAPARAPPLIHISFPPLVFACGHNHYRTAPMELVAQRVAPPGRKDPERAAESQAPAPASAAPVSGPNQPEAERSGPAPVEPDLSRRTQAKVEPVPPKPQAQVGARYSLRKDGRVWRLVFGGQEALVLHEQGVWFAAWLFYHPPAQPLHALDLAAQIPHLYRVQLGLSHLADPATGKTSALASHARLQERSLSLDDAQTLRALRAQERELEAILEDEGATEPERAEALRELEAIAEFQRRHGQRSRDAAQRAVRAVRAALTRLHGHLAHTLDEQGQTHPVLVPFAEHLRRYVLVPSGRYSTGGNRYAATGLAGCFTYEPPPGVRWGGGRTDEL